MGLSRDVLFRFLEISSRSRNAFKMLLFLSLPSFYKSCILSFCLLVFPIQLIIIIKYPDRDPFSRLTTRQHNVQLQYKLRTNWWWRMSFPKRSGETKMIIRMVAIVWLICRHFNILISLPCLFGWGAVECILLLPSSL